MNISLRGRPFITYYKFGVPVDPFPRCNVVINREDPYPVLRNIWTAPMFSEPCLTLRSVVADPANLAQPPPSVVMKLDVEGRWVSGALLDTKIIYRVFQNNCQK